MHSRMILWKGYLIESAGNFQYVLQVVRHYFDIKINACISVLFPAFCEGSISIVNYFIVSNYSQSFFYQEICFWLGQLSVSIKS